MKYILKMEVQNTEEGAAIRLILLTILNLFVGLHSVNGEHFNLGLGLGPMEVSLNLHRWNRWLP